MKLLAGKNYDFLTTRVNKATTALLAMTAFDTTNLRLTFTAPGNGSVLVRMRTAISGAATAPQILLGILDGATVRGRQAPIISQQSATSGAVYGISTQFLVTGLTGGQSYTWDAAYGVEFAVSSTNISYGGLDDTSASNAYGGFQYEIYDTQGLLAGTHYDPGTADTSKSIATAAVMAVLDTTNLRLTFTMPSSGNVLVRMRGVASATTTAGNCVLWGVLDGATIRGRVRGFGGYNNIASSPLATDQWVYDGSFLCTGLTGGTSYTWDAAYGVEVVQTSGVLKWGGPNDNTQDNAWGGFSYEIWNVDSLPAMIGATV